MAVANCVTTHSAQFGAQIATRSPGSKPERQQPRRERIDPLPELAVGPADALLPHSQRVAVAVPGDGPVERDADRLADQLRIGRAMHITQFCAHRCGSCGVRRSCVHSDGAIGAGAPLSGMTGGAGEADQTGGSRRAGCGGAAGGSCPA